MARSTRMNFKNDITEVELLDLNLDSKDTLNTHLLGERQISSEEVNKLEDLGVGIEVDDIQEGLEAQNRQIRLNKLPKLLKDKNNELKEVEQDIENAERNRFVKNKKMLKVGEYATLSEVKLFYLIFFLTAVALIHKSLLKDTPTYSGNDVETESAASLATLGWLMFRSPAIISGLFALKAGYQHYKSLPNLMESRNEIVAEIAKLKKEQKELKNEIFLEELILRLNRMEHKLQRIERSQVRELQEYTSTRRIFQIMNTGRIQTLNNEDGKQSKIQKAEAIVDAIESLSQDHYASNTQTNGMNGNHTHLNNSLPSRQVAKSFHNNASSLDEEGKARLEAIAREAKTEINANERARQMVATLNTLNTPNTLKTLTDGSFDPNTKKINNVLQNIFKLSNEYMRSKAFFSMLAPLARAIIDDGIPQGPHHPKDPVVSFYKAALVLIIITSSQPRFVKTSLESIIESLKEHTDNYKKSELLSIFPAKLIAGKPLENLKSAILENVERLEQGQRQDELDEEAMQSRGTRVRNF